jgi:hypothetical protein
MQNRSIIDQRQSIRCSRLVNYQNVFARSCHLRALLLMQAARAETVALGAQ